MSDSYKVYASQDYVDNKIKEIDTSVDWNAKEGEPGYVENRTHYEEGIGVFELDASCLGGVNDLLTTTSTSSLGTDSYIKITDKIITLDECEAAKIILVKPSGETVEAINRKVLASLNGEYIYSWQYLYNSTKVNVTCVYVNTPGDKKFLFEAAGIDYLTSAIAKESGFYIIDNIQAAFVVVGDAGYSKIILNFGEYTIKTLDPKYLAAAPNKSKTTILPKTTLTVSDPNNPGDGATITTPFAEYPSAGDTWNITYNGLEYACEFIDASIIPDIELPFPEGALYFGGNLTAMGFEHIASNNDAPFVIMAVGSEEFAVGMEAYGMIMPIVTLDQTFTVSITKGSEMAPSQLTLRSNGEMVWEEKTHWIESGGTVELIPVKEYTQEELETQMAQPLSSALMAGKVYEVTLGETAYSCPAVPVTEEGVTALVLGNTDAMGVPGGNPDAPFIFIEVPPEIMGSDMPYYWSLQPIDENILSGETVNFGITFSGEIIHKIDSKYLPSYDWNAEKDEPGYIENRTHWTTTKTVEILPTVEVVGDGGGNIYTPLINIPSVGETYIVNWNGIDCECVAEQFMNEGITGYAFGRTKILGGAYDTGDFAIIVSKQVIATDSDGKSIYGMVMGYANMANPNVISIIQPAGAVHKLDDKFIPDTIARVSEISYPVNSVNGYTGDVTLTANDVGAIANTVDIREGSGAYSLKGNYSHNVASGKYAVALGLGAEASGTSSVALGGAILEGNVDNFYWLTGEANATQYISRHQSGQLDTLSPYIIGDTLVYNNITATITGIDTSTSTITVSNTLSDVALSMAMVKSKAYTKAHGMGSYALGYRAMAKGDYSLAIGQSAKANGTESVSIGRCTLSNGKHGSVLGKFNLAVDPEGYYYSTYNNITTVRNTNSYQLFLSEPAADMNNGIFLTDNIQMVLGSELKIGDIFALTGVEVHTLYEIVEESSSDENTRTFRAIFHSINNYSDRLSAYALIVGNGEYFASGFKRSNAHVLDWDGNARFAGDVYVNGTGTTGDLHDAKKVATEEFVNDVVNTINVIPDWNENNPDSPAYIANRTHYENPNEVVEILAESSPDSIQEDDGMMLGMYANPIGLEAGNKYRVKWNGVEYECVAASMLDVEPESGLPAAVIGNHGAMTGGDDTGEPFIIMDMPSDWVEDMGAGTILYLLDGSTELTLSIDAYGSIKKIDKKYLDLSGYAKTENVNELSARLDNCYNKAYIDNMLNPALPRIAQVKMMDKADSGEISVSGRKRLWINFNASSQATENIIVKVIDSNNVVVVKAEIEEAIVYGKGGDVYISVYFANDNNYVIADIENYKSTSAYAVGELKRTRHTYGSYDNTRTFQKVQITTASGNPITAATAQIFVYGRID